MAGSLLGVTRTVGGGEVVGVEEVGDEVKNPASDRRREQELMNEGLFRVKNDQG